jgi:molybdate/tungstate transport system permease protein
VFLVALAGWPGIVAAYADPAFLASLSLTLSGATVATAFAIFLTAPAAYGLVHASLPRSVAAVLEGALASPVAVPHVVVGLAILVTFSPLSPLARILGGFSVLETFGGMVAAFFVVSAPLALSTLKSAFAAEDPRLHLAARALGATPTRAFLRVTVPTHGRSFVEAFFVAWARSVSEFGSVAILTYFVFEPAWFGGASPASVFVFAQYQASGLYVAMRFAAALLFVSVLPLVVLAWYRRFHAERS